MGFRLFVCRLRASEAPLDVASSRRRRLRSRCSSPGRVKRRVRVGIGLWIRLGLAGIALACLCLLIGRWGLDLRLLPAGWMVACMVLIAECVPLEFGRRAVRITFTLPFAAALAAFQGPAVAALVALAAASIVRVVGFLPFVRDETRSRRSADLRTSGRERQRATGILGETALLWGYGTHRTGVKPPHLVVLGWAVAAGGCAAALVPSGSQGHDAAAAERAALFAICYSLAALLATLIVERGGPRGADGGPFFAVKAALLCAGPSCLLAAAVAVLVRENCLWALPIALVPMWTLRSGLAFEASTYARYYETIKALTLMLQRAHPYTHGHLERVADYAEQTALKLGFAAGHARLIREASVLHDLGKIAVDEAVLDKPGRLSDDEMRHVRLHAELGATILAPVRPFQALVPWVRHHHERPDGRGYPDRMLDVEIPLESKIIAVADAFDAMTLNESNGERRPYREPMTVDEALDELERCCGTQFDPTVVAVFREVVLGERAA